MKKLIIFRFICDHNYIITLLSIQIWYKAIKKEIEDLNRRIAETKHAEILQFGTVKGSRKYFPYTPQNFKVTGIDPAEATQIQDKVSELKFNKPINEMMKNYNEELNQEKTND